MVKDIHIGHSLKPLTSLTVLTKERREGPFHCKNWVNKKEQNHLLLAPGKTQRLSPGLDCTLKALAVK